MKEIETRSDSVIVRYVQDGEDKTMTAKFVVCTLPLGVLKTHHSSIFKSPPLPDDKVSEAIGDMHLGSVFLHSILYRQEQSTEWVAVP